MVPSWSLRLWLPLSILLLLASAIAFSLYSEFHAEEEQLHRYATGSATRAAANLSNMAERTLLSHPSLLEEDTAQLGGDEMVSVAAVISGQDEILFATDSALRGRDVSELPWFDRKAYEQALKQGGTLLIDDANNRRIIAMKSYLVPARHGEIRSREKGLAYLVVDTNEMAGQVLGVAVRRSLLEITVFLAAIVLFGVLLNRYVVRPLRSTERAARELSTGNFSVRVQPQGPQEVRSLVASFNDMAARLQANVGLIDSQALSVLASEERLRNVMAITGEGIWEWDMRADQVSHNARWCEMLGYGEDMLQHPLDKFTESLHPEDRDAVMARVQACLRDDTPYHSEHRMCRADGSVIWVQDRGRVTSRDEQGRPLRMLGSIADISARMASARRDAENLRRLKELSALGISLAGEPDTVFEQVVRMVGDLFGVRVVCLSEIDGANLHFRAVCVDGQVYSDAGGCPLEVTPCATVEETQDLRIYDRVADRFPQASFLREHHAFAYCGFPSVNAEGRVVAVTCLLDDKPHEFAAEEQELLRVIGQRIAVEIERYRAHAAREQAEQALRTSEARYRMLFETMGQGVVYQDQQGRITSANPAAEDILGLSLDQMMGRTSVDPRWRTMHEDGSDFPGDTHPSMVALRSGEPVRNVLMGVFHPRENEHRWILVSATPQYQEGETRPFQVYAVFTDITERRKAELALLERERSLSALIDSVPGYVYRVANDPDYTPQYISPYVEKITGYSQDEYLVSRTISCGKEIHPDDSGRVRDEVQACLDKRLPYEVRYRIRTKSGGEKWVWERGGGVCDEQGVMLYLQGFVTDVTASMQAEEALRNSRDELNEAQRIAKIGNWMLDLRSNQLTWSEEIYRLFGIDPAQFGASYEAFLNAIHPEDRNAVNQAYTTSVANHAPYEITHRLLLPDGQIKYVRERCETSYAEDGTPLWSRGTVQDISDIVLAEQEIRQLNAELEQRVKQRTTELEAVNRELEAFSYSVSHDLRTPLRAIDGFSLALLEDYGHRLDASGQNYLQRVRNGAQRMGRLIDDLLNLARVSRGEFKPVELDMSALAQDIIAQLRAAEPQRSVKVSIEPGMRCYGDFGLARIMLENLLGNAWKYTGKRRHAHIDFGQLVQDGVPVCYVRDNGAGFDMQYAGKLFGAFQRLHKQDEFEGTGVGLATVMRIVHRHGGNIWAEAIPDRGATFYFTMGATI